LATYQHRKIEIDLSFGIFSFYHRDIPDAKLTSAGQALLAEIRNGRLPRSLQSSLSATMQRKLLNEAPNLFNTFWLRLVDNNWDLKKRIMELRRIGRLREDPLKADLWMLVEGDLYVPRSTARRFPLVIVAHGNYVPYQFQSQSGGSVRYQSEVYSHKGFNYVQEYLATHGICSFSMSHNIASLDRGKREGNDDPERRRLHEISFDLFRALNGNTSAGNLMFFGNDTKKALLINVLSHIDLTKLGHMGHSRSGNSIVDYYNALAAGTITHQQNTNNHIKCLLSLQPNSDFQGISDQDKLHLTIAGTHDEDVGYNPFQGYESSTCPKLMSFINAATHTRFNTEWARLGSRSVNRLFCFNRNRIMSNRGHINAGKVYCGAFFRAVLNSHSRAEKGLLELYTGRIRANALSRERIAIGVHRVWQIGSDRTELDEQVRNAIQGNSLETLPPTLSVQSVDISDEEIPGHRRVYDPLDDGYEDRWVDGYRPFSRWRINYGEGVKAFRVALSRRQQAKIFIPLPQDLRNRNMFSCRIAKGYDVTSQYRINRERQDNFKFYMVDQTNNQVGNAVMGRTVRPSLVRAYRFLKVNIRRRGRAENARCDPVRYALHQTNIVPQTVEIPMRRFIPPSDARWHNVEKLCLEIHHAGEKREDDILYFLDVIFANRSNGTWR
jgi:hypothetical protein